MVANTSKPKTKACRRCGAPLAGDELARNCPRCLSALLFSSDSNDPFDLVPTPALRRIGDYELIEEVARGGMGIVFRARQAGLDRFVVVKLLRDSLLAQPEDVKRFRAEAAAAGKLKHPNIVAIHAVGEEHGQHYIAMALVAGPNLAQLTREGPLEPRRAAELTAQIANAVQHAHGAGILHRDLKPSNVLVDGEGVPFVTDFGLARTMDAGSSLTLTGQVLGTPAFMSPEQAGGFSEAVGPAADVYSLGALLFHLLTGRPPFVSNSVPELLRQVAKDEPLAPQSLNASVPSDLATVCLKCLAKRPADRYGSARELEEDLRRFLRKEPIRARPAGAAERLWRWCRREPALAASLGFALVVLIIGGGVATWQWLRAEKEAHSAKEELWHSQLQEARSYRLNGGFGQRTKDLEIIAKAAAYRPSVELRNEAIAALVLPDVGTNVWWRTEDNPAYPVAFTGDLEFFLIFSETGHVAVCQSSNQRPVAEFAGPAASLRFAQFSPDARFLGVRFRDGAVRVWDWRAGSLVLAANSWQGSAGYPAFDFSPDSRELWLANPELKLERYTLPEGKSLSPLLTNVSAMAIRLDRAGRRLLAFEDKMVSAWDVAGGESLGEWVLARPVWCAAWHPQGREFAVGAFDAGIFLGEVGQTNLDLLEGSGKGTTPVAIAFTPDGSHVLAGGWGNFTAIWDFAAHKLALHSRELYFGQLSNDGLRVALGEEARGYGVRSFLNPVGVRRLRVPPQLGTDAISTTWHPNGRWLAVSHTDGWSLWDMTEDKMREQRRGRLCSSLMFLPNGNGLLTGGRDGPFLWPITISDGQPSIGEPRALLPADAGANERAVISPDGETFAAVGIGGTFFGSLSGRHPLTTIANGADSVMFSPDGRWLCTGGHRSTNILIYALATGNLVANLPSRLPLPSFLPGRDELLVREFDGLACWQVGSWKLLRRWTAHETPMPHGPIGLWPDGSCALVSRSDDVLRLWNIEAGREIAALRLPEGSDAWGCLFDPSGRFMATTSSHPFLRLWDFRMLRRELRVLGLDWPDAQPGKGFVGLDGMLRAK